jgi:hypothetical protein
VTGTTISLSVRDAAESCRDFQREVRVEAVPDRQVEHASEPESFPRLGGLIHRRADPRWIHETALDPQAEARTGPLLHLGVRGGERERREQR